ncbi:MAG: glycosyltransferase family 4 protein [Pseudomonadota bacterium]
MKVCFVGLENLPVLAREYNSYGIGGAQVQLTLLAKAFARRKFDVSMVVGDYGQDDGAVWEGITTYKAYKFNAGLPIFRFIHPRWTGLWSALRRASADVYITSCAGMQVGLVSMFCRRHFRRMVYRMAHDTDAEPDNLLIKFWRDKKLYEYGLKNSDCILAQSLHQRDVMRRNYKLESIVIRSLVVPPLDVLEFNKRDIDVLWVNNLRQFKRPDLLLSLAHRMPQTHFHLVGGPQPDYADLYSEIETQAKSLPNMLFYGRVPYHTVNDLFARAKVFANTSESEGFPNSYLQSWVRGVPVVAFFDPDGVIRREGLGMAVASLDEMHAAVENYLKDRALWESASARCRAYMSREFDEDTILAPYIRAITGE